MRVEQNGTSWDTGKRYYQLPKSFGTEVRSCAVAISLNFHAKGTARNNFQQFSTKNKRCFGLKAGSKTRTTEIRKNPLWCSISLTFVSRPTMISLNSSIFTTRLPNPSGSTHVDP